MMFMIDRAEKRSVSTSFTPNLVGSDDQSMNHKSWHQYGPDGAEVFRLLQYYDQARPGVPISKSAEHFILSDGTVPVVEYDKTEGVLKHYHIIPGLNVRLAATTQFDDHRLPVNAFYRSDHRGSTIYITDFYGEVKTDFLYKSHDGQLDLFGLDFKPRKIDHSAITPEMLQEHLSFYVGSGSRLDIGMDEMVSLEMRTERLQAQGLDAAHEVGAQNPYGFSVGKPYAFLDTQQVLKTEIGPSGVKIRDAAGFLDRFQLALDAIGMVPFIGEPFDLANGFIHLARGNEGEAALSFTAIIPFLGTVVTGAKIAAKTGLAATSIVTALKGASAVKAAGAVAGGAKMTSMVGGSKITSTILSGGAAGIQMGVVGMAAVLEYFIKAIKRKGKGTNPEEFWEILRKLDPDEQATVILEVEKVFAKISRPDRADEAHHLFTIYANARSNKGPVIKQIREIFERAGWSKIDTKEINKWNIIRLSGHEVLAKFVTEVGKRTQWGHTVHYHQWLLDILIHRGADKLSGPALQKVLIKTAEDVAKALHKHPALIIANSKDYIRMHGGDLGMIYFDVLKYMD
jgi:hypothetical protein